MAIRSARRANVAADGAGMMTPRTMDRGDRQSPQFYPIQQVGKDAVTGEGAVEFTRSGPVVVGFHRPATATATTGQIAQ